MYWTKTEIYSYLTPYIKINSREIRDFDIKNEITEEPKKMENSFIISKWKRQNLKVIKY